MRYEFAQSGFEDYQELPVSIQKRFEKQLTFLLQDLRYPSLQAKKYDESKDLWQARVDRNYRFYFQIKGDRYVILRIIPHPK
jgi:mRNA interferase RelE/StbE